MSNLYGWFKVHRELYDKPIWLNSTPEHKVILMALLGMANFKENSWDWHGEKFSVKPGMFVTSIDSIIEKCGKGVTVSSVRSALKRFEKLGFITNKSTNRGRVITIVNWELYQDDGLPTSKVDNRQETDEGQSEEDFVTSDTQAEDNQDASNKERKEIKKNKNDFYNDNNINGHSKKEIKPYNKEKKPVIEVRKNFDVKIDKTYIYDVYESIGFGDLNNYTKKVLDEAILTYSANALYSALKETGKKEIYNIKYTIGMLKNWKDKGLIDNFEFDDFDRDMKAALKEKMSGNRFTYTFDEPKFDDPF